MTVGEIVEAGPTAGNPSPIRATPTPAACLPPNRRAGQRPADSRGARTDRGTGHQGFGFPIRRGVLRRGERICEGGRRPSQLAVRRGTTSRRGRRKAASGKNYAGSRIAAADRGARAHPFSAERGHRDALLQRPICGRCDARCRVVFSGPVLQLVAAASRSRRLSRRGSRCNRLANWCRGGGGRPDRGPRSSRLGSTPRRPSATRTNSPADTAPGASRSARAFGLEAAFLSCLDEPTFGARQCRCRRRSSSCCVNCRSATALAYLFISP